ncbi:hypothetical protein [Bradyrhizobium elkanii]|uniref:Uncharacterized protein n=1 Tax=Bradyrhizobium elkanii TaxID=29448 RepID=A0ABV4F830_BRAEL|nr:hypothetical protein [Bradyrhizobium elkanii]MCP1751188.1 hypothetical protein [Bradyrhizobium elkanii]MCP1976960.1 hypothetical protein [Bradyrhizobium elkanii]MCS3888522.1 hypothetical protein [Bradyrhizobium elkanii]MCS4212456.1 hypothetical protein [Bradyrhizobium elkanii]MCW2191909.1 hypothetical protein [Bradyrhizobium elkanii]
MVSKGASLGQIADALEVSRRSIRNGCIQGKRGKILSDGSIQLEVSPRQLSATRTKLAFMRERAGLFYLQHEPTEAEKPIIRKAVGLKKKPLLAEEILARLKNNLPSTDKTLSSCRNEGL